MGGDGSRFGGRPTKRVPTTHARIIKALKRGATHKLAAAAGGVSPSTFADWMRDDPTFSAAVRAAEAFAADRWLKVIDEAMPDDWRAAAWKLERRYPHDYGKTVSEQQHSGVVRTEVVYTNDWKAGASPTAESEAGA